MKIAKIGLVLVSLVFLSSAYSQETSKLDCSEALKEQGRALMKELESKIAQTVGSSVIGIVKAYYPKPSIFAIEYQFNSGLVCEVQITSNSQEFIDPHSDRVRKIWIIDHMCRDAAGKQILVDLDSVMVSAKAVCNP